MSKKSVARKPARKPAKKRPKPREGIDRPFNNGRWSESKMRGFVMSALRRAAWPAKHDVIKRALVGPGINPATGHKCLLHRCEACLKEFPKTSMKADHAEPIVPLDHNWAAGPNWLGYDFNKLLPRLWIEVGEGWNVFCETCHNIKSAEEKAQRAAHKTSQPS